MWFINAVSARDKNDVSSGLVGGAELGDMMNSHICVAAKRGSTVDVDDLGDAGVTVNDGGRGGGGVGGYEWELDDDDRSWNVNASLISVGDSAGILVRECMERAASQWWGDAGGTGVNGMNTPGGKRRDRMRIYHPRLGRCIDQHMVDVGLC